ncbi:MAG TPA: serine hydrolase domain-containing protein [Thermoanaerobaculia bacterium]|jgi:CubicO group peptidase (beta-lactamase class C family)
MRVAALLLSLAAFSAHAQDVDAWLAEAKVPAVGIAVIKDGQLRQVRVHGELVKGTPAPYDTIFNVASLTKPVVSMLTWRLIAEKQWQLDEPLAKYWVDPDVAGDPRHAKLTTRHVLGHTTGFKNWRFLEESEKLTFHSEPGEKAGYSGEGFEYLRRALEKKFGRPLQQLAQTYVFEPAGMRETRFAWDASVDESRFARWHDGEGKHAYPKHKTTSVNAADDLLTTAEDYGRFAAWVLNGAGLPEALFLEMQQANNKMALGWENIGGLPNGGYALLHGGSDRGVKAMVVLFPKTKEGLVLLMNGENAMPVYQKAFEHFLRYGKELWALGG